MGNMDRKVRKGAALLLLKLRGVVEGGLQEEEDDGETQLVRAAADGLTVEVLQLLLDGE